jgi:hypothetical protein
MVFFLRAESMAYLAYALVAAISLAIWRPSFTAFEIKGLNGIPAWPVFGLVITLTFLDSFSGCFQKWALLLGRSYQVR